MEQDQREGLRRLHAVLDRLLRRMTRRYPGSPREMQMDAAAAIDLLLAVHVPNREYLSTSLARLIRELGQRRPDLFRHVTLVEAALNQLDDLLARDADPPA